MQSAPETVIYLNHLTRISNREDYTDKFFHVYWQVLLKLTVSWGFTASGVMHLFRRFGETRRPHIEDRKKLQYTVQK